MQLANHFNYWVLIYRTTSYLSADGSLRSILTNLCLGHFMVCCRGHDQHGSESAAYLQLRGQLIRPLTHLATDSHCDSICQPAWVRLAWPGGDIRSHLSRVWQAMALPVSLETKACALQRVGHVAGPLSSTRIDHDICDMNCWIPSRTPSGLGFSAQTSGSRPNVFCR